MLLDIFATKTNQELSTPEKTMFELLTPHLDRNLMPVSEFMAWYIEKTKQLDEIEAKIGIARELSVSVPPLNYIGRIIVSTIDDTEQKVVARYGGKRWRRIENFLRGVSEDDPDVGRKLGEEYVELRESNVPIHTHKETLKKEQPMASEKWMAKDKGGSYTKLVNTTMDGEDVRNAIGTKNQGVDYQISPLEYASKERNDLTLPHDNMPPYMKVYIWECVELTDEERIVTGEPEGDDDHCVVSWLSNGGTFSGNKTRVDWERKIGDQLKKKPNGGTVTTPPQATKTGSKFIGWKRTNGTIELATPQKPYAETVLDDEVVGNTFYTAQWAAKKPTVTFVSHGGIPETMSKTYNYGDKLGYLPTLDEAAPNSIRFKGWFPEASGGSAVGKDKVIDRDYTFHAQWE
jgi:hypothetical protein